MTQLINTTSAVNICSNALLLLGAEPINDFAEDSNGARLCANLYVSVRNDLMRRHTWNCCTRRVQLAPDKEKPAFGWQNRFTIPSDFARLISVNDGDDEYEIESRHILLNRNTLDLVYVFINDNEPSYDAMFVRCLTLAMKAELAYPITRDMNVKNAAYQEFILALGQAKTADGQDQAQQQITDSPLMRARFS